MEAQPTSVVHSTHNVQRTQSSKVFGLLTDARSGDGGGKIDMSSDRALASAVMQKQGGRRRQVWLEDLEMERKH